MNEQDVRTLLDDLAHTPQPPSRVDVDGAMTTARRRTRTRAWTSAAASVLVVGLAVGVTYAVIDRSPPGTGSSVTAATTAPAASAPRRFDPLVRYASFGWLPERDRLNSRSTGISGERFELNVGEFVPDPANGPNAALPAVNLNLRLYAAGVVPQTEKPMDVTSGEGTRTVHYGPVTEAPAVNGAPAYWVGVPNDPEQVVLKWRYAPDGWAELYAEKLPGDAREVMHRVASEVRVGGTERLRFPFHLTGLSPDLKPTASQFAEGGLTGPWEANLDVSPSPDDRGPTLSVSVRPTNAAESKTPNTTVDGHPARRETFGGEHLGEPQYSDRLYLNDLNGLQATILIAAPTDAAAAPLGPDGVVGAFRALTLHPDTADWTDQPLR